MVKNVLHIVFLLLASLTTQGQEYFSSVHIDGDNAETTTNIVLIEGGYATFGVANVDDTPHINIRKYNLYGEEIEVIQYQLEGNPLTGHAESFHKVNDGGYIWVGRASGVRMFRFDTDFDLLWSKEYLDLLPSKWKSFEQAYEYDNGDFLILGRTHADGEVTQPEEVLLIKTDNEGNIIWHKVFGDINDNDRLIDILPMDDGGFVFVGAKYFPWDAYIVKIDSEGNKEWHKSYGGDFWDYLARGVKTQDGNIVIAFEDSKEHSNLITPNDSYTYTKLHLIKIDPQGNTIWDQEYSWLRIAYGAKLIEATNGDLIFIGKQNYPSITEVGGSTFALRTNSEGDSLWFRHYSHSGFGEPSSSEAYDIEQTDYGFVMAGVFRPTPLNDNYTQAQHTWIMHIDENGCVNSSCEFLDIDEDIFIHKNEISLYPNPADDKIFIQIPEKNLDQNIDVSFYTITGQLIEERSLEGLKTTLEINIASLFKGIYIVKITGKNQEALASELLTIQ